MRRDIVRVLAVTLLAPLAAAVLLATWRVGVAERDRVGRADVAAADAAAERWMAARDSGAATPALAPPGYGAAVYLEGARVSGGVGPETLPPAWSDLLLSLDDGFLVSLPDGGSGALAPLKDAERWDVVGAALLARTEPAPATLPLGALSLGILALLLTAGAAAALERAARRGGRLGALGALAFAPGLAWGTWLLAAEADPGARLWTLLLCGAWVVAGLVGLSLAAEAARPLAVREGGTAWLFLGPSLLHLLLFSVGPILFALWLSFHEWSLVEPARPFVGLDNYARLLEDGAFWRSVLNTAIYVLFVPVAMVVALGLALLVDRRFRGVRFLRTVFFLPYITSFVAISLTWRWMYEPELGLLNALLRRVGLGEVPWLTSPATALPSLMLMSVWMYAGYMMVIFLAGLQSIPQSLYESAKIDGAGPWHRFRRITLPLLRPTTLFVLVTMVIFMFQVFTAVYVMTEGGPLNATDVIVYHIYRNAWEYLRMGYASAMSWVLFAIVFLITLVQLKWLGGRPGAAT